MALTPFHNPRNNAEATVITPRAPGAAITVSSGAPFGTVFPIIVTPMRGDPPVPLCILEVTNVVGNVLTVSGAIEGTTDAALVVGDVVKMLITRLAVVECQDAIHALEDAVISPGGAVGTVQFNDDGEFGGFGAWDGATLEIPGKLVVDGGTIVANAVAQFGDGANGFVNHAGYFNAGIFNVYQAVAGFATVAVLTEGVPAIAMGGFLVDTWEYLLLYANGILGLTIDDTGTVVVPKAEFTRYVVNSATVVAAGSPVPFPAALKNNFEITLAGNWAFEITGATYAQVIRIKVTQAAAGGPYAIDWSGIGITWYTRDFAEPTMPPAASSVMIVRLVCTGSNTYDGFLETPDSDAGGAVSSVFTRTGDVVAGSGDYNVSQVTGAAPLASPTFTGTPAAPTAVTGMASAQLATCAFVANGLALKANLNSPALTGLPTAPTAAPSTNTTQVATCQFVLANVGGGAVSSIFTRTGAIVAATGDYNVSQVTGAAPLASPTFTGVPLAPTATVGTNTTQLATCQFVMTATSGAGVLSVFGRTGAVIASSGDYSVSQVTGAAPLASPSFTGSPTAPNRSFGTNTTELATTAFVQLAVTSTPFIASGVGHAGGAVPDPGGTAGGTRFLREDATWQAPPTAVLVPLFDHYVDAQNTGTTETDLYSVMLPANQLAAVGDKLIVRYAGRFAASSGTMTRQLRVYLVSGPLFDSGALMVTSNANWVIDMTVIRTSTFGYVRVMAVMAIENAPKACYVQTGPWGSYTFSASLPFKLTGQAAGSGAASGDIIATSGSIVYIQHA